MALQNNQQEQNNKATGKQKATVCEKAVSRNDWREIPDSEKRCFSLPTFYELKNLIIFLLLNIAALLLLDIYPEPSAQLRSLLGIAPPLLWINLACSIYLFTELVLVLCRERHVNSDRFAWKQLFFLSTMYGFYWYAGALPQHITLLLGIGVVLQLLEAFARKNRRQPVPVEE